MAYYNFDIAHGRGINPKTLMLLQIIKQNKTEELSHYIAMMMDDSVLECLEGDKMIHYIKGKKDQSDFQKMRLTKKGDKLLADCQIPVETNNDLKMFGYLCEIYLSSDDEERKIGNKKKTAFYCSYFRKALSLSLHEMYWLCWLFLQEYEYTKTLQYLFFNDNKNRYGKFENNLEDSPLFQFLDENRERIELFWQQKIE